MFEETDSCFNKHFLQILRDYRIFDSLHSQPSEAHFLDKLQCTILSCLFTMMRTDRFILEMITILDLLSNGSSFKCKQTNPDEDLPKMLMFCDWLSETKMIIVRDSFFRKTICIVLSSFIVIINQPRGWIVQVDDDPLATQTSHHNATYTGKRSRNKLCLTFS
jgi:hypothetical protein